MLAFTPDAVRALHSGDLDGVDRRLAALERAAAMSLPTPDDEVWRYSRIKELDLAAFAPGRVDTTVTGVDGSGATVDHASPATDLDDTVDVFHLLNLAFSEAIVVRVPRSRTIAEPIVVSHRIAGPASGLRAAVFPRLIIDVGEDAEVTVVEQFVSDDGDTSLVVPRVEVQAAQSARVRYLGVNLLADTTWSLGHQRSIGERDPTTLLATVALGGDYARVRTEARVTGQGASTRQIALYFADGEQMHDFRTLQDHAAPKTSSDLLFKGAVQDHAKSVYTGLIHIRHNAKGSVAFQTNRNLTLSEGAWAESVPNLEIETNDVKCSHASTVGPIDEEQRFYLESRGIPPEIAQRLVVLGFFDEVLDQMPVGPLAAELRARVEAKLTARTAVLAGERVVSGVIVCRLDELAPNSATRFDVAGRSVAVIRIGDDVYAIGDTCSHADVSLSEGELFCESLEIECWKHGSLFSIESGAALTLPATQPVPVFVAGVVEGDVQIDVEANATPVVPGASQGAGS